MGDYPIILIKGSLCLVKTWPVSQPLHDLHRHIASQGTNSGRVVAVTGGIVRVATAQGVVEVSGSGFAVGDRVVVRNGAAVRMQGAAGRPPHIV
ncbi:hypothetical protein Mmc1_1350 [Magnetococcus marinus MC-1]|uniref:Uncharacterized protein n=1 Tax=Magnetococcus marinus (strain ATCC BAA-1437 / JCM 17883 / MC-1) TaxID=156889 RepID=A0L7B8_MAGMM|nr:hypothetical protein Mmc1_1350 [Magnetococcus marinus MC-1]